MSKTKRKTVDTKPYTLAQQQEFADAVSKLVDLLGLNDWNWMVRITQLDEDRIAELRSDVDGRTATICLTSLAVEHNFVNTPKRVAAHEIAHLLIADYEYVSSLRNVDPAAIQRENEKVATRLERVLAELL